MAPQSFVVSEEKTSSLLTLIVDKKGIFGSDIAQKIHTGIATILVTAKEGLDREQALLIPYTKIIPEIPEGVYSHMFFVWDGRSETLHVLEPLLEKALADKAQFLFITDYRCFTPKLGTYIHQHYSRAIVFLTGDVFGNDAYISVVTKFFHQAQKEDIIRLENVGLTHIYPVLFADVVEEMLRVGFGTDKGKIFLAMQQHGMTELSFAHALQKINPFIKIDFVKEESILPVLPDGTYAFGREYPVVRKIQDAYTDYIASKKEAAQQKDNDFFFSPLTSQKEKQSNKKKKRMWTSILVVGIFLLISPILVTLFYAGLGGVLLYATQNAVQAGNYVQAVQFAQTGENVFALALAANTFLQKELQEDALTNVLKEGALLTSLAEDSAKALGSFSAVARGTSRTPQADFLTGINAIKNIFIILNNTPWKGTIAGISLPNLSNEIGFFGDILDISPTLFGFPEKKTYLVLFQNNMELRPGGGFIGSYALISLQQGRITNFAIHDVYDADGQLKGHIEPPYVVRRYIPQQHWYLRDSNFDVDFSQDGANAAFFLQQETQQKVDGVIGVDLTFVKDMLAAVGPVYVPEYNQTVDANTLFLLTETHAEKNTFAGSTQKKDFLHALFTAMQTKVTTQHGFSPHALQPLLAAVKNKDIVFGFSDSLIQDVFTVSGLSSTLWDGRKSDVSTILDTTGINEANIGVNKANYFITRKVNQDVSIDKTGNISGILSITYTNMSVPGQWPGGDYKNYLRIILPSGTKLSSITFDGTVQQMVPAITQASIYEAPGFIAPKGLEVDSTTELGKQLFGFIVTIPSQKSKKIDIGYVLSQKINMSQPTITYDGWLFKQPGVDAYPYTFSLTVPNNFSLLQQPSWTQGRGNSISFTKSFGEDTQFSLLFGQK